MFSTPVELRDCLAPAKLNLFLHAVSCRPDGYHLLQTVPQLIDRSDMPYFARHPDRRLVCTINILGMSAGDNLVIRAARLLQTEAGCIHGVDITIERRLPIGGDLGGGSSDVAITLFTLNRPWGPDPPRAQLMKIGLELGADMPFSISGQSTFAEEIGEKLTPIALPPAAFVVIRPRVHVPTPVIFSNKGLARDTPPTIITNFPNQQIVLVCGRNGLQAVAERRYGETARAFVWLRQFSLLARTTGSGTCIFTPFNNVKHAQAMTDQVPSEWKGRCATGLAHHPLARFIM